MSPPNQFKPQLTRTAAQRLEEKPLPLSDGLGQLADGADDFGAIHARWASVYFKSSEDHPAEWLSLATAAILLAVYFHSAGLLVEAWAWIGQATRLAVPLGLNTDSKRFSPGPQLTCPPADEIERIERINLWWLMYVWLARTSESTLSLTSCRICSFSMDSFATAGSGWNGAIHLLDVVSSLCCYHCPASDRPLTTRFNPAGSRPPCLQAQVARRARAHKICSQPTCSRRIR